MEETEMTKEESIKCWGSFSDSYMQTIGFWKYKRKNKEDCKVLKTNIKYKELYKGKRCFVLGNGPSLNDVDFEILQNEYVFTVNELMRHDNFSSLHSNFHLLVDPVYFKLKSDNNEDRELIKIIKSLEDLESPPTIFAPIESRKKILEYRWVDHLEFAYFCSKLYFYNGFNKTIDFTKFIPEFQAVVQWAVAMAVYMGFHEIYLLGCDATNAIIDIAAFMGIECDEPHAYRMSENDKKWIMKCREKAGLEAMISGYSRIFEVFRELYSWCERQGVSLINCSSETVIESIPRKSLSEILR